MANILHFLPATICLLSLISQGNGLCYPVTDLKVSQSETGEQVLNKQQWKVIILNDCICAQLNVKLACDGFHSVEKIDSSMMVRAGDTCHVNDEQPLYGYHSFNFTYSWDVMYPFHPIYSELACS